MSKLEGIKRGDRVRVTFEGGVDDVGSEQIDIIPDKGTFQHIKTFRLDVIRASGFKIERIEPPLSVLDKVSTDEGVGQIISIADGEAWVRLRHYSRVYVLRDLERIA